MALPKFNKMFVMVPVMLLARKIDTENPKVVNWIRIGYAAMQIPCILIVLYTYMKARSFSKQDQVVYVPPAPTPFADPNAKKKYTETTYGAHVVSTARSLVGSTLMGVAFTLGMHYYKGGGMVMGLAIQTIMAPLNLAENPLVKALLLGQSSTSRWFDEKKLNELEADDEIVDDMGNPVARQRGNARITNTGAKNKGNKTVKGDDNDKAKNKDTLLELLLDTWDAGAAADIEPLMKSLNSQNCNKVTAEDGWSPLMVLSGLGASGTAKAVEDLLLMGADPCTLDIEGWNAAHWAAFHGSIDAARVLMKMANGSSKKKYSVSDLLKVTDKEGLTPVETAKKEGNTDIAAVYEEALGESKKSK